MNFFAWLIKTVVLDFLWEKGVSLVSWLIAFFKERGVRKKIEEDNRSQADIVRALADQIKALEKAGKEVPDELKEKFREANRKLIRESLD